MTTMAEVKVDPTIHAIAKKYGIDPEKLAARMRNLTKLKANEGLIVDLDIGKWNAQTKLREEDLGIEISEEERRFISLGHQKLFPPEIVNRAARAESQGRDNLERHSFLLEEGRFVPLTAWHEWKKKNEEAKMAFFGVRDEIGATYDTILETVKKEFAARASAVYDRMEKKPENLSAKPQWIADFVRRLISKIPTKNEICSRFYWTEKFRFLRMPSEIEEELLRQEKIRREREMLYYEQEDKKAKIREMNEMVLAQLRAEKEKAVAEQANFIHKIMLQQRQAILECTTAAVTAITRNKGRVLGPTVKALKKLVEQARNLNFYEDSEIQKAINSLEGFLKEDSSHRSARRFSDAIHSIKEMMEKSVRALENEATREEEMCRIVGSDLMGSVRSLE